MILGFLWVLHMCGASQRWVNSQMDFAQNILGCSEPYDLMRPADAKRSIRKRPDIPSYHSLTYVGNYDSSVNEAEVFSQPKEAGSKGRILFPQKGKVILKKAWKRKHMTSEEHTYI